MKSIFALMCLFAVHAHADVKGYVCLGTEPFYSLKIQGTDLTLETPEDELPHRYVVTGPQTPEGLQDGYVSIYRSEAQKAVISIVTGECTDGMSENKYGYHLVYVEGGRALYGCCEPLAQD